MSSPDDLYLDERLLLVPTKYANSMIAYKPTDEDAYYVYRKAKTMTTQSGTKSESYRCRGCERSKEKDGFVSTTCLRDGRMVREPDAEHRQGCQPMTRVELEAMKLNREMVRRCRGGEDAEIVFESVLAEGAATSDLDEESSRLLREKIGSFDERKSALKRLHHKNRHNYDVASSRERRRLAAVAAAQRRKAKRLQKLHHNYAMSGAVAYESVNSPAPVQDWSDPNFSFGSGNAVETLPTADVSDVQMEMPALERNTARAVREMSLHQYLQNQTSPLKKSTNSSLVNSRLQVAGANVAASSTNDPQQALPGIAMASISDITKALDSYRKKTRWESFGDYIAKTLESMPEEKARKAAREMQEIVFSIQSDPI